jgi:hypothetical protein
VNIGYYQRFADREVQITHVAFRKSVDRTREQILHRNRLIPVRFVRRTGRFAGFGVEITARTRGRGNRLVLEILDRAKSVFIPLPNQQRPLDTEVVNRPDRARRLVFPVLPWTNASRSYVAQAFARLAPDPVEVGQDSEIHLHSMVRGERL